MLGYLDAIGVRKDAIQGPPTTRPGALSTREPWTTGRQPAAAYLYDLGDTKRLAAASAEATQVPPAVQLVGVPRWCTDRSSPKSRRSVSPSAPGRSRKGRGKRSWTPR